MLDIESAVYAEMGCIEIQYSIFELKGLQAQEKLVAKRAMGGTTSWLEYCKICRDSVPVDNYMEGGGSLLAENKKEEEVKRTQKKANPLLNPERPQPQVYQWFQSQKRDSGQFPEK